jgi:hypothetical protein
MCELNAHGGAQMATELTSKMDDCTEYYTPLTKRTSVEAKQTDGRKSTHAQGHAARCKI